MPKRDYYDDPAAPKANSIVVAVTAAVRNPRGELLLIERTDNGLWALPGGGQDLGESVVEAARREVREETGIDVEITGLSGIYSDPRHVIAYDNGEVRQEFSLCFHAKPVGGELRSKLRVPRSTLDLHRDPAGPQHPSIDAASHHPRARTGTAAISRLVGQHPG
jgi:8-oxo-dGTP pyrophosphatase MutT (NUDIX family)